MRQLVGHLITRHVIKVDEYMEAVFSAYGDMASGRMRESELNI